MTETDPDKRMRDIIAGGDVNVDRHSTNSVDDHSSKDDHSQSTDIAAGTINVYHGTKKGGNRGLLVAIFILIGIIVAGVIVGGVMFVNMSNTSAQDYTNTITQPGVTVTQSVIPQYTVNFNTGGYGYVPSQTINEGGYVEVPTIPTRDRFIFDGWYLSGNDSVRYNFSQPVYSNLTLVAKWKAVTHTVSFNTGGYGTIDSQTLNHGDHVSSPATPTRSGYTFGGWYTSTSYNTPYDFSTPVTGDITLYAKWVAIQPTIYLVSFNTGGYGSITPQKITNGNTLSRPAPPSRDGYEFDGWYTSSSYITPWDFSQPVTADMTLYAKWSSQLGSADNPILISSASDFMKIYNKPSLHYKLIADIDLTGRSIPDDIIFRGSLDGDGFSITGNTNGLNSISLDQTKYGSTRYFGLFSTNSGTIKNLKLMNFGVDGNEQDYAGISDRRQDAFIGCVAGLNTGVISNVTLENCKVKDMRMWGGCGLVSGYNKGTISNCVVNGGHITGDCDIGGIVGVNEGTVRSCSIHGSGNEFISFTENSWVIFVGYNGRSVGGIVGYASSPSSLIESCSVNNIKISYDLRVDACYIGSIVGSNSGRVLECTATEISPTMEKCGVNNGTMS